VLPVRLWKYFTYLTYLPDVTENQYTAIEDPYGESTPDVRSSCLPTLGWACFMG
jgi:hypothetical protein